MHAGLEARLKPVTAAAMASLAACELLYLVGDVEFAGWLGRCVALVVMLAVTPRFGLREWAMLAVAVALTWGLMRRGDQADVILALDRGAFFASFIMLMMLLREAAMTSPSVLTMGHYLTRQQPGRRFFASFVGGHLAGVLLNFGAISLLAPLVQRGVRSEPILTDEDERRAQIRERRALSALVRGFALVITWAPTNLTQAIILASVPGLHVGRVMALGLGVTTLMLAVGWAEDRLRWGRPRSRAPGMPVLAFPWRAAGALGLVGLILISGTYTARAWLGITTAQGLMTMAPLMLSGWVFVQNMDRGTGQGVRALRGRLAEILGGPVPKMTRDAYTLGAAGFIGVAAASLAPIDDIAHHLNLEAMPAWVFLSLIPVIIVASGNIAISPIMVVVFLAAVISALPVLPADPDLIALSLGAGWAMAMTASPNATGPIMLGGITGLPVTTLTWRWNGVYSLCAMAVLSGVFWVLA